MVLCWRMYNLELPIAVDPGKDICGVSPEVGPLDARVGLCCGLFVVPLLGLSMYMELFSRTCDVCVCVLFLSCRS